MHLETALEQLVLGEKACYRAFFAPDDAVFSDDEAGGNTRMSMRASIMANSRASIALTRRSMSHNIPVPA